MQKKVSIVLGSYNRYALLPLTIASIREEVQSLAHEIIVIDGGSTDGALEWLAQQKDIITIVQHNRGEWHGKPLTRRSWGYFMNLGFKCAQGEYISMISDDAIFVPGSLQRGIAACDQARNAGMRVGGAAFYFRDWPKDTEYHVAYSIGDRLYVNHGLYVNAALQEVCYVDEDSYQFYNADADVCLKLWHAGYSIIVAPDSYVEHYPYANHVVRLTNEALYKKDYQAFIKKWTGIFYDPREHNIGKQETKIFYDPAQTVQQFASEHAAVAAARPQLVKPDSGFMRLRKRMKWKYQALVREFKNIMRLH